MGKSITPKYRVIMDGQMMVWRGKASEKALEEYVKSYAKSLEAGGCNAHISKGLGYIPYPNNARIETNEKYPAVIATWKAGMFQVW